MSEKLYDLCVIGSGAAGIIVALEYLVLKPNHKVALIEFGKDNTTKNHLDDSIVISNAINHHDPYECTNKGLGGTTATWGGRCVMFDEVDFIDRPIVQNGCTWNTDFYKKTLPFCTKAATYFECGTAKFNLHEYSELKDSRIVENFCEGDITDSVVERWSMPTRFGKRYKAEIVGHKNIDLWSGYQAVEFDEPDEEKNIQKLVIAEIDTKKVIHIVAKQFVIAAGTQETTRLLLRNKQVFSKLSNVPKALGKYYQGHVSGKIASVVFTGNPKKTNYGFIKDSDGIYLRRRFQFSTDFLVKNNLLNTAIWLDNPLYNNPNHKSGAMSFMYLAMLTPFIGKRLAPPAIAYSITKGKKEKIGRHLLNIVKDFPSSLITPATIFYKRYLLKRKLPGIFLYSAKNVYALHFHAEQVPDVSNAMRLADDHKTLVIDYNLTDADVDSVIQLHERLDNYLREIKCGYIEYWYPKHELVDIIKKTSKDGIHQSGTTRIGESDANGVVDDNLRVFGTNNLFVCSCSVLPTSSQANPTFFMGVLAVKLANHLASLDI